MPLTLLGKHAAYTVRLTARDFARFDAAHGALGLGAQARACLRHLREAAPDVYTRVFGCKKEPPFLSSPYDALACAALLGFHLGDGARAQATRRLFDAVRHGPPAGCQTIGNDAESPGIPDPAALKDHIVCAIEESLHHARTLATKGGGEEIGGLGSWWWWAAAGLACCVALGVTLATRSAWMIRF